MERHQGDLGARVGRVARSRRPRRARGSDEPRPGRRVPEVRNRERCIHPRAFLRPGSASAQDGRAPVRRRPSSPPPRGSRLSQGVLGVQARPRTARSADGDPGAHRQGMDTRHGFEARNSTHQIKKIGEAELRAFRDLLELPISDKRLADAKPPYYHPGADSDEVEYLLMRRRALGGDAAAQGGALQAARPARGRALRRVPQRQWYSSGVNDHGVRRTAAQPAPRPGHRQPGRSDHPRRGTHLRHGCALQRGEDLRAVRAELRAG